MTVIQMSDQIMAQSNNADFCAAYNAPLSLDAKEVISIMQLLDHTSVLIKSDHGMSALSGEYINCFTMMLFGRLLGLNKQYIALQNAAVQDQVESILLSNDDGDSCKETQ